MLSIKLSESAGKAPEAVPFMPPGLQQICATVNGQPGKREVMVDSAACERLQADLLDMLSASAAGEKARPVLLFDHQPGAAAAIPQGFEWDEHRGILLRVEWTQAGREAVEGGNYGYISPAFLLRANSNEIAGLNRGVEVGSLVNDPAFEKNECIAAARVISAEEDKNAFLPPREPVAENSVKAQNKNAAGDKDDGGKKTTQNKKMEEIKKMLGLAPDADDSAILDAIAKLKQDGEENKKKADEIAAECEKAKDEVKQHKEAAADSFVDKLKNDGAIAPKDEDRLKAARELYLQNPKNAEIVFAGMRRADFATSEPVSNRMTIEKDERSAAEIAQAEYDAMFNN